MRLPHSRSAAARGAGVASLLLAAAGVLNVERVRAQADTTLISSVQGSGAQSPLVGEVVTLSGVVVADFQGDGREGLGGFFLQEEPVDVDAEPSTSEGIWIYQGEGGLNVEIGQRVAATGEVTEFGGLTQIDARGEDGAVVVLGTSPLPDPEILSLPVAHPDDLERLEGMRVTVAQAATITEVANLDRFGTFTLSAGGRIPEFTECNEPSDAQLARYDSSVAARKLVIDDGREAQDLPPALGGLDFASGAELPRAGDAPRELNGVVDERFGGYRLQATHLAGFRRANPRPTSPPARSGDLRVAGVNVLNYFNGDGRGGGFPTERGARSPEAFARQEAKLVAGLCALEADVLGLVELENDGYGPTSSPRTLMEAIERACGLPYDVVEVADVGTDDIRVAVLYRSDVLTPVGGAASLSEPAEVFRLNRVPVAASFEVVDAANGSFGEVFTVAVNHLRSKGGDCRDTDIPGDDATDGSGACDGTRTRAAVAIAEWLAADPTGVDDADALVVGDLNAYRRERPIAAFLDRGFVDVVAATQDSAAFPCGGDATYTFRGRWGALDHALATTSLAAQVGAARAWHVNTAESDLLAYWNEAFASEDYYRFSDHDPVVIDLTLAEEASSAEAAATPAASRLEWTRTGPRTFRLARFEASSAYHVIDSVGRFLPVEPEADGTFRLPDSLGGGAYFLRERTHRGAVSAAKLVVP